MILVRFFILAFLFLVCAGFCGFQSYVFAAERGEGGRGGGRVPTYRFNLNQCIEKALLNNNQIQSARHEIDLSKAKLLEAHPKGIPVVKYEHKVAPVPRNIDDAADSFFGGDISVLNNFKMEVGSALTTFGKIKTAQELAAIGIDASWFQKDKTVNDVVFKIYQIYQGILLARELLDLASQAEDAINGKIREMNEAKVVDQIGILKLKLILFEVERKMEEAKKKEALALSALKVQLGMEDDVDLDIRGGGLTQAGYRLLPMDYYLELARNHRPEYQLLNAGIFAKEKKAKLEELNYAPNLGVGGFVDVARAPGITGSEDENNFTNPFNYTKAGIGLQLKGEFDYVKTNSKVKQAQADLLKSVYDKRAAMRGLELDIQQTYLEIKAARNLIQKAEEEMKTARQIVFLTKSNLEIGLGEKKDYLDALQSYLVFQGRRFESIYNYNVAVYELKKKTGVLLNEWRKEIP